jgi:hypothetical protein
MVITNSSKPFVTWHPKQKNLPNSLEISPAGVLVLL